MSQAATGVAPALAWRSPWLAAWALMLAATLGLWLGKDLWPWVVKYPRGWVVPLKGWIGDFMKWLINDFDLGLFTFKEFTRGIAWVLEWPQWLAKGLLAKGFKIPTGEDAFWLTPTLSWLALIVVLTLLAYRIKDRTLALLIGFCFLYLAVFGQWDSAMITLSSIMVAVPLGVAGGLALGIQGYRSPRFERAITPVLDLMQTVPVFAYLVPILFLFGFGPVAAMIATMIYAMPPMVRVTLLALKAVPEEIKEFGRMAGCSRRQMTWKVLVPAARPTLMVGVNQVIMLSLNMVIIASMIGAGGLGHDVLASLRRLAIGEGLEAGIAITLLAIALDRLSQAFAVTAPAGRHGQEGKGLVARQQAGRRGSAERDTRQRGRANQPGAGAEDARVAGILRGANHVALGAEHGVDDAWLDTQHAGAGVARHAVGAILDAQRRDVEVEQRQEVDGDDLDQMLEGRRAEHGDRRGVHLALFRQDAPAGRDEGGLLVPERADFAAQPVDHEGLHIDYAIAVDGDP